jgi:hypothetical protein
MEGSSMSTTKPSTPAAQPHRRQLEKMQKGRERARLQARKDSREKVRNFKAWLKAGSPMGPGVTLPSLPTDADFRAERAWR